MGSVGSQNLVILREEAAALELMLAVRKFVKGNHHPVRTVDLERDARVRRRADKKFQRNISMKIAPDAIAQDAEVYSSIEGVEQ